MWDSRKLSVIVPAYNVESFLRECVESILKSDYENLEVVVVDDGSTDATPQVADDLAKEYEKVQVIHQENAGLSAARNTGIDSTESELIAFVDSDDLIMPDAYSKMAASLKKSGSGFVVGAVHRFDSEKEWAPWFVEEAHTVDRYGITGQEFAPILWNVFAWSKLFDRQYFNEIGARFPVGMLYEDQEISAKLYLEGGRFDVLSDVVYLWRSRDDGSSITQNKTSVYDLEQRLAVARATERIILSSGSEEIMEYWYRKLLNEDLWWYFRVVPQTNSQYWNTLCAGVREFVEKAPGSAVRNGHPKRRDLIQFAIQKQRSKFEQRLSKP